jgi:uncharacterized protein (TIGR02147 family)
MKEQMAVQKLLHAKYEEQRHKNPAYSRRAFAKKLGLSAGAISELFNGRRQVSRDLARKLADRLLLDPQERSELFRLFPEKRKPRADEVASNYLQLSADQFHVIGEWYHFAILTLMRTANFKSDPQWIAERLGLPPSTIKQALERLKRMELIAEDRRGNLTRSPTRYRTTDDVANVSVKKAHLQYLESAKKALEQVPVRERDFTSVMMAVNPKNLPKAKERIRKFQDDMMELMETNPRTQVYQMLISLFPLTGTPDGQG